MRISDWSSDVCSSDLIDRNGVVAVVDTGHGDRAAGLVDHRDAGIEARNVGERTAALRKQFQLAPADRGTDALVVGVEGIEHAQIGRASCRGRVGQYV